MIILGARNVLLAFFWYKQLNFVRKYVYHHCIHVHVYFIWTVQGKLYTIIRIILAV